MPVPGHPLAGTATWSGPVACSGCVVETGWVHGYVERRVTDVPVDGRRAVVRARMRRMRCSTLG